jgi:hypothetical protein
LDKMMKKHIGIKFVVNRERIHCIPHLEESEKR